MQSNLDNHKEFIVRHIEDGHSKSSIAKELNTSRKSINRALARWAAENTEPPVEKVIDTDDTRIVTDPDSLMQELGVDPKEWSIRDIVVNRWGSSEDPQYQLKARLAKNIDLNLIVPATGKDPVKPRSYYKVPAEGEPRLVVAAGDQHAPFHDPNLHRLFVEWLANNQPHEGILLGDLCDFPEISRHRHKPEWKADTQECINSGYSIVRDYVTASEETKWSFIPGNHDERIRNTIIDYNRQLYNLKRAYLPGQSDTERSVWSLSNLLKLDELGVGASQSDDPYHDTQYIISSKIAARHGWIARPKSGATAHSTLDQLGHSIIVGHTHRRGFVYQTKHEIDGSTRDLVAIEAGCMCLVNKATGLGYSVAPDWQQGFVTITVWPDGSYHAEPAVYVNNKLLWRDQVYV